MSVKVERESSLDRPLPERLDMERLVFGAALTDRDAFPQIADVLRDDDFAIEKHKRIFRGASALHDRGEAITYVSLGNELLREGQLESVDGLSYLVSLSDGMPHIVNLAGLCDIIRNAAVKRRAIQSAAVFFERCFDPSEDAQDLLACAERITEVLNPQRHRQTASRVLQDYIDAEGGINPFLSPERKPGIRIPFESIHETLSGLRRSKFIIVGARPAVGKTAFATQLAERAAADGNRVLFITLEMSGRDLFHRSITGRAQVNAYRFRKGLCAPIEKHQLQAETTELVGLGDRLRVVEDTTVHGIANELRRLNACGTPVDLCVVDYLQLLGAVGSFENRVQEVSKVSRELKKISQAFHMPVVALCQLKRVEDHRKNERPELDWLKESGQLEQDADQVLFLWVKKEPEEGESIREVHWRVAKNRDGALNHGALSFRTKYCRFDETAGNDEAAA